MNIHDSKMTPIDKNYETCAECYAELRIYSKNIQPDEICYLLKIGPSKNNIKDTSVFNKFRRIGDMKILYWSFCSQAYVKSKDLRNHVDWLSHQLKNSADGLKQLQTTNGVKVTLACIWYSKYGDGGPVLWPAQMRAIADLGLECCFEIHYDIDIPQLVLAF